VLPPVAPSLSPRRQHQTPQTCSHFLNARERAHTHIQMHSTHIPGALRLLLSALLALAAAVPSLSGAGLLFWQSLHSHLDEHATLCCSR